MESSEDSPVEPDNSLALQLAPQPLRQADLEPVKAGRVLLVLENGVEVFDPVEFDAGLRRIDVAADLAFLVMDLERAGRGTWPESLSPPTARPAATAATTRCFAFYGSYRAWVRAKVAFLRAGELACGGCAPASLARQGEGPRRPRAPARVARSAAACARRLRRGRDG